MRKLVDHTPLMLRIHGALIKASGGSITIPKEDLHYLEGTVKKETSECGGFITFKYIERGNSGIGD